MFKKFIKICIATLLFTVGFHPIAHATEPEIKIGVLQYVEHEALDAVLMGFKEQIEASPLGKRVKWDIQNANGENALLQSISEKLARDNDVLFAIATPAAQALAAVETKKPIFIAAVTDPVAAGLANSLEKPGRNVTGTSDLAPIKEQVELLVRNFPEAKRVGLIYNSSEVNSQVLAKLATETLQKSGLQTEEATVASTNDIAQVLPALLKKIDVLFLVTDNTIDSSITLVGNLAKEAKIPTVGSSEPVVLANGLVTLSNSYKDFGVQTADMFIRQVEGNLDVATMPIETAQRLEVVVNQDFAKALGIDPDSIH